MQRIHGGIRRVIQFTCVALLACGLFLAICPARANDINLYGELANGCVESPVFEACGGWSLFWHDPDSIPRCCHSGDWCCHTARSPRFYGTIDFLPLFRDESDSTVFQAVATRQVEEVHDQNGTLTDTIISYQREAAISSGGLGSDFEPGVRVLLGLSLSDFYRLEFTYQGSYSWSDSATALYDADDGTGNLLSPFSNFGDPTGALSLDTVPEASFTPVTGLDFNDTATVRWSSRLNNCEWNVRRRLASIRDRHVAGETSCLVGLRYTQLRESLHYRTESSLPTPDGSSNREDLRCNNDMFGVQIGALGQLLVHDRAWIDLSIKGALLFDHVESRVTANVNPAGIPIAANFSSTDDATAFLGDLSLQFNYQFAPAWTLRLGYNAIWISGVALANQNFVSDINTLEHNVPQAIDHSGNVVFHGPNIGIVWAR